MCRKVEEATNAVEKLALVAPLWDLLHKYKSERTLILREGFVNSISNWLYIDSSTSHGSPIPDMRVMTAALRMLEDVVGPPVGRCQNKQTIGPMSHLFDHIAILSGSSPSTGRNVAERSKDLELALKTMRHLICGMKAVRTKAEGLQSRLQDLVSDRDLLNVNSRVVFAVWLRLQEGLNLLEKLKLRRSEGGVESAKGKRKRSEHDTTPASAAIPGSSRTSTEDGAAAPKQSQGTMLATFKVSSSAVH